MLAALRSGCEETRDHRDLLRSVCECVLAEESLTERCTARSFQGVDKLRGEESVVKVVEQLKSAAVDT